MKTETNDIMQRVSIIGVGVLGSWTLQDVSYMAAIFSGVIAGIYGVVQIAKLLREWYILEKNR
jgi:tellurite resistance protein TehA-like permease